MNWALVLLVGILVLLITKSWLWVLIAVLLAYLVVWVINHPGA